MVDADRGHHGHVGVDDVGGIQASTQPYFEHGDIDVRPREQIERRERVVLEEGQRELAARGIDALEGRDQRFVTGLGTVDADAFVVAREMRRRETPDALARRAQDAVEKRDGGTLAVGAAHGDDTMRRRQQIEPLRHFAHARQSQVYGTGMGFLLPREPGGQRGHYCGGAATAAGCRMSRRSSPPSFSRMSRRSTMRSSAPWSSRNSLR